MTNQPKITGIDLAEMIGARIKKPSGEFPSHLAVTDSNESGRILYQFMKKWDIKAYRNTKHPHIVSFYL